MLHGRYAVCVFLEMQVTNIYLYENFENVSFRFTNVLILFFKNSCLKTAMEKHDESLQGQKQHQIFKQIMISQKSDVEGSVEQGLM